MATFAIETDFVVPSSNTLPTSGSDTTSDLTPGQFGIYLPNYVPATAVTAASARYLYLAQGRPIYAPGEGTKRSDRIYAKNIIAWYKMSGQSTTTPQITTLSDFTGKCGEDLHVTLRFDSFYVRTAYFNGLTRSVMTTLPCCDCGANPCDDVEAADIQAAVDDLKDKINADTIMNVFVTATRGSSGATSTLVLTAKALDQYGNACDLTAFPFMWDRLSFWTYAYTGPDQTNDYTSAVDSCDDSVTITVTQRASLPVLTDDEVAQVEKDNFSYQALYKHIFSSPLYNGEFASLVESGVTYDMYYLKFKHEDDFGFGSKEQLDEAIGLYIPTGETAATEAILVAAFGTPVNITSTHPSSNTSTVVP